VEKKADNVMNCSLQADRVLENSDEKLIPEASPPNVFIGGPVPVSPGFPIEAFGNDSEEDDDLSVGYEYCQRAPARPRIF
jgi:hypothetical protein